MQVFYVYDNDDAFVFHESEQERLERQNDKSDYEERKESNDYE